MHLNSYKGRFALHTRLGIKVERSTVCEMRLHIPVLLLVVAGSHTVKTDTHRENQSRVKHTEKGFVI